MILKLLTAIIDFFYPPACPGCGKPCDESNALCHDCRTSISFVRVYDAKERGWPHIDVIMALAPYRGGLQDILNMLKFSGKTALLRVLTHEMSILWEGEGKNNFTRFLSGMKERDIVIVPVPTDERRRQDRGFDLPEELFNRWSEENHFDWHPCLVRARSTKPQYQLSGVERRTNMQGAIEAKYLPAQKVIVIVDDILTTGATMIECARALRAAGGEDKLIIGLALASDSEK